MSAVYEFSESVVETLMDDKKALGVIMQRGLLERLSKKGLTDIVAFVVDKEHSTHWLLCVHIEGHAVASENGYMITAYPKRLFDWPTVDRRLYLDLKRLGINWLDATPIPPTDEMGKN